MEIISNVGKVQDAYKILDVRIKMKSVNNEIVLERRRERVK